MRQTIHALVCVWALFVLEESHYVHKGDFATSQACVKALVEVLHTEAMCVDWKAYIAVSLDRHTQH